MTGERLRTATVKKPLHSQRSSRYTLLSVVRASSLACVRFGRWGMTRMKLTQKAVDDIGARARPRDLGRRRARARAAGAVWQEVVDSPLPRRRRRSGRSRLPGDLAAQEGAGAGGGDPDRRRGGAPTSSPKDGQPRRLRSARPRRPGRARSARSSRSTSWMPRSGSARRPTRWRSSTSPARTVLAAAARPPGRRPWPARDPGRAGALERQGDRRADAATT